MKKELVHRFQIKAMTILELYIKTKDFPALKMGIERHCCYKKKKKGVATLHYNSRMNHALIRTLRFHELERLLKPKGALFF